MSLLVALLVSASGLSLNHAISRREFTLACPAALLVTASSPALAVDASDVAAAKADIISLIKADSDKG